MTASAEGGASPTVLLVDPQPTTRASLRRLLEDAAFEVCGESADARDAVEQARRLRPDLCLIEPLIPGGGSWAIAEIVAGSPQTATVVLSSSEDREHLFDAIRAGAAGYLIKDMDPARIPMALKGVLAGEAAIPRKLVASLVSDFQSQGRQRLVVGLNGRAELTRREWDVAQLIAVGESTASIAARLYLSPVTVRRHLSEVVRKLGVADRAAAIELLGSELGESRDAPPPDHPDR